MPAVRCFLVWQHLQGLKGLLPLVARRIANLETLTFPESCFLVIVCHRQLRTPNTVIIAKCYRRETEQMLIAVEAPPCSKTVRFLAGEHVRSLSEDSPS